MESLRNVIDSVTTFPAGGAAAPYCCRLSENFHCWDSAGPHTSTLRPPFLAARLSRHRLLPTCRSLELPSICSHFCERQQSTSQHGAPTGGGGSCSHGSPGCVKNAPFLFPSLIRKDWGSREPQGRKVPRRPRKEPAPCQVCSSRPPLDLSCPICVCFGCLLGQAPLPAPPAPRPSPGITWH